MVGRADFDSKLTRVALVTNPHMTAVDRKWTLWSRYLDSRRTLDFNLQRVINAFGQPVRLPHLAKELNSIYGRPMEIYEEMLERMTKDSDHFFTVGKNSVALSSWLLDTEAEIDDDRDDRDDREVSQPGVAEIMAAVATERVGVVDLVALEAEESLASELARGLAIDASDALGE